jgi:ribosome assembly protein 1
MAKRVDVSSLVGLQQSADSVRNFCILAHVDHGKTTLSDSLISSNGIISEKLAGKLRFLDSSEEEQKRGITMQASAISLLYREDATDTTNSKDFLVNLVDCPGHIDFSSDVSAATRLCDGALIVVDVLEGICTQTHAVLFKALKERLRPCLVLNKIDRLVLEMRLSEVEAFHHLRRLVENVNALVFTLVNSELMKLAETSERAPTDEHLDNPLVEEWYFSPDRGNIVFCSAYDCWGFSIAKFIGIYAKQYGLNRQVLRKYIFEDYSFNPTTKKIVKCDSDSEMQPMFACLVLAPIWRFYHTAMINGDPREAARVASAEVPIAHYLFFRFLFLQSSFFYYFLS